METKQSNLSRLLPIMFAFFTMGFVDTVGAGDSFTAAYVYSRKGAMPE